jgi:hypothetical protein
MPIVNRVVLISIVGPNVLEAAIVYLREINKRFRRATSSAREMPDSRML